MCTHRGQTSTYLPWTSKLIVRLLLYDTSTHTHIHPHLLAEPVGLFLQVAPVLLGPLAYSPEGIHHDATVAAASVEMKVGFSDRLQLRNDSITPTP